MSESFRPKELFWFSIGLAWHICGCEDKGSFLERLSKAHHLLSKLADGHETIREQPSESRENMAALIEKMQKGNEIDKANARMWLAVDQESDYRRQVDKDRRIALFINNDLFDDSRDE